MTGSTILWNLSMYSEAFKRAYSSRGKVGSMIIYHDEAGRSKAPSPFAASLRRWPSRSTL